MTDLRTRDEVDPSARGRRGAHRAAPSRLAALLPVVVVAAVVVLTVLALVFFTGLGGRGASGEVSADAPTATATRPAPPETSAPTTTTPPPTSDPSATSPSPSGSPSSGGSGSSSSSAAPGVDESGAGDAAAPPPGGDAGAPDARGAPVVVLNATRTSGLAARTADDLKGKGWSISRTGDADGSVDATQVRYSDPALEGAAQAVAASLDGAAVRQDDGAEKGVVTVVAGPDRVGR